MGIVSDDAAAYPTYETPSLCRVDKRQRHPPALINCVTLQPEPFGENHDQQGSAPHDKRRRESGEDR